MNRRSFLRSAAGLGGGLFLPPSMVWPFRKIFIPAPRRLTLDDITAIQIAWFSKQLPDLLFKDPPWMDKELALCGGEAGTLFFSKKNSSGPGLIAWLK
jgi:hypothetical protein